MTDYTQISVKRDEFESLRKEKPGGVTWTHYLKTLRENYEQ